MHKGHRYLFEQLRKCAAELEANPLIFTFLQHPRSVLTHDCPPLLTTVEEREQLLGQFGDVHFFDFAEVQPLTALQFLDYLADRWKVKHLMMGFNHHFGSDGRLTDEQYAAYAQQVGIKVLRALPFSEDEQRPSSTKIRTALLQGRIQDANKMLGYEYMLTGRVVHGRMIGRQIGFPTANIMPQADKLIPAAGVYKVKVLANWGPQRNLQGCGGESRGNDALYAASRHLLASFAEGVVNIGTNPTVGNTHQTIEVHIPGFEGDLYNQSLTMQFIERIRSEQRFDSLDELQAQIRKDIESL